METSEPAVALCAQHHALCKGGFQGGGPYSHKHAAPVHLEHTKITTHWNNPHLLLCAKKQQREAPKLKSKGLRFSFAIDKGHRCTDTLFHLIITFLSYNFAMLTSVLPFYH